MRMTALIFTSALALVIAEPAFAKTKLFGKDAEKIILKGDLLYSSNHGDNHQFSIRYKNDLYICIHSFETHKDISSAVCTSDD